MSFLTGNWFWWNNFKLSVSLSSVDIIFQKGQQDQIKSFCCRQSVCLIALWLLPILKIFSSSLKLRREESSCVLAGSDAHKPVPPFTYAYSIMGYIYNVRNSESSCYTAWPDPSDWMCLETVPQPCLFFIFIIIFYFLCQTKISKARK